MNVQFCPLHEDDIYQACRLLESSLPEHVYNQTLFSCAGYPAYLQAACRCGSHSSTLLIGAYIGDILIGYAEWRRMEQMLVLNNIHVDEAYQNSGIGKEFMAYGEKLAKKEGINKLVLDVFWWNEQAHTWYQRLGFVEEERTYWYEKDLNRSLVADPDAPIADKEVLAYIVDDYPMAEAHHLKYGFSSLKIRISEKTSVVGRLGEQYYRIQLQHGEWEGNSPLTDALMDLDQERRLLLLSSDAYMCERDPELTLSTESIRMIKILENLEVMYE